MNEKLVRLKFWAICRFCEKVTVFSSVHSTKRERFDTGKRNIIEMTRVEAIVCHRLVEIIKYEGQSNLYLKLSARKTLTV